MKPKLQSEQFIVINASIEDVWNFNQDLSKIAEFHPSVRKVDLISNKQFREEGVSYQCNFIDGKNSCIEKDIEIVPFEKIVTVFPNDTIGLSKLLPDYIVETNFVRVSKNQTKVAILHFYSSKNFKVRLLNFIIKPKIAKQTTQMLNAMKKKIESEIINRA